MGPINVTVTDANNVILEVTPTPTTVVEIDRGVAGNGIVSIVPVTISTLQYLRITYTNGTVSDVGPLTSTAYFGQSPISIVGNTISLTTVPIQLGGTGQTTANDSFNALAPSQTGNSGKYLTTDGTNTLWAANPLGTVTSVSGTGTVNGLTLTGTVTTSGSLTLGGTLDLSSPPTIGNTTPNTGAFTTLTTSSTVTLNGGTANGVAYLNGSKVLTTGSALTFDGTTLTNAGVISTGFAGNGTAVEVLQLKNLGAGDNTQASLAFYAAGTKYAEIIGGYSGAPSLKYNAAASIGYHQWQINSSEQMRLTSTGLGIKTSNVTNLLTIGAGSFSATGTGNTGLYTDSSLGLVVLSDGFYVATRGGAGRFQLDSSGNLGLGVTPSAWWSSSKAIQVGSNGAPYFSLSQQTATTCDGYLMWGARLVGDRSFVYQTSSDPVAAYRQNGAVHAWFNAPSGTAGNAISFTQAMTLDASGNLGVGLTNPAAYGGFVSQYAGIGLHANSTSGAAGLNLYEGGTGRFSLRTLNGSSGLSFFDTFNSLERARITSSGNFLLGTTGNGSPGLGVANSFNISFSESTDGTSLATMFRQSSSGDLVLGSGVRYSATANAFASSTSSAWARSAVNVGYGAIKFFTAAEATVSVGSNATLSERARIDSIGNFGLGTTAPNNGGNNGRWLTLSAVAGSTYSGGLSFAIGGTNQCWVYQDTDNLLAFQGAGSNAGFKWMYGGTERARIDSSGNFLCGTTSAIASGKVSIQGSGSNPGVVVQGQSDGFQCRTTQTSGTSYFGYWVYNGTNVGSITSTGTTTAYNTSSDYRLKNITGPITNSGAYIDSLNPVEGTWKADGSTFVGLIAHEAQEVSRTPVATGTKDGEQMQGMDYSSPEIIANLIAEVKSLRARLAAANI